jgi:hypothetical protein
VLDGGGHPGLALESLDEVGFFNEVGMQDLQRDGVAGTGINCAIDRRLSAGRDLLDDLVRGLCVLRPLSSPQSWTGSMLEDATDHRQQPLGMCGDPMPAAQRVCVWARGRS